MATTGPDITANVPDVSDGGRLDKPANIDVNMTQSSPKEPPLPLLSPSPQAMAAYEDRKQFAIDDDAPDLSVDVESASKECGDLNTSTLSPTGTNASRQSDSSLSADITPSVSPDASTNGPLRNLSSPFMQQAANLKSRSLKFFQGLVEWAPKSISPTNTGGASSGMQRERKLNERKAEWETILPNFKKTSLRRIRNLCWQGIPPSIRGRAWLCILGNDLKITPDLYRILSARAQEAVQNMSPKSGDGTGSREDSMTIIEVDVPRTFPELKFFHGDGPLRQPLLNVLRTYVTFRPDIGYIQGMSYIAAMLLLNLDSEEDAFIALANLLNREMYFTLFQDFSTGQAHLEVYESLLRRHLPRMAQRFKDIGVLPSMYLYDWILTIFSRSFPLDVACRIWDSFLVDGSVFVFRAALGIIKMYGPALYHSSFEQSLNLLNHIPKNMDPDDFFECIASISISSKQLQNELEKARQQSNTE